MKISKSEVRQIIRQEVRWCEGHSELASNPSFADGFVAGLKQALYLITEFEDMVDSKSCPHDLRIPSNLIVSNGKGDVCLDCGKTFD